MPNGRLTEAITAGREAFERLDAGGQPAAALHAYSQVGLAHLQAGRPERAAAALTEIVDMTPYFIRMKVENVGGTDLSYASLKLDGVLEGGAGTGIVLIGDLPGKCDRESAPREFTTKGASYETCSLTATKGAPVTAAQFDEGDVYSDSPVVWNN